MGGKCLLPKTIQTSRLVRSYDNLENQTILAFVRQLIVSLDKTREKALNEYVTLCRYRDEIVGRPGDLSLSLAVIGACIEFERPLTTRIESMRKEALRLLRTYDALLPDVRKKRFRLPKRTKVFQEVRHYVELWHVMERWASFGDFEMLRDGLLLSTYRMDKLYEYYALYKILDALSQVGFSLDEHEDYPIELVSYTLASPYYSCDRRVANLYHLRNGAAAVDFYYQPIIYGDVREEGGIRLHRTTPAKEFSRMPFDSYWTPDYLLVCRYGKECGP